MLSGKFGEFLVKDCVTLWTDIRLYYRKATNLSFFATPVTFRHQPQICGQMCVNIIIEYLLIFIGK